MSKIATIIAKNGLGIKSHDPMSGFFGFRKKIIDGIKFDAIGYKTLFEILVKTKDVKYKKYPILLQIEKKVQASLMHLLF